MKEKYKVYAVEPIANLGIPIIITACSTDNDIRWFAEYYVLIPDDESPLLQRVIDLNSYDVPKDLTTVDIDFMLDEALIQAKMAILQYLQDHATPDESYALARNAQFAEDNTNLIVAYWMRSSDQCRDALHTILSQTRVLELKPFLSNVIRTPHFRHQTE